VKGGGAVGCRRCWPWGFWAVSTVRPSRPLPGQESVPPPQLGRAVVRRRVQVLLELPHGLRAELHQGC